MLCPKCNAELPEGTQFCTQCGSPVTPPVAEAAPQPQVPPVGVKTCPQCGALAAENAVICPQCGMVFGAHMPAGPVPAGDPGKNGLAVAGLVLGIIGLCFCGCAGIASLLALIFGCSSLKSQRKGMAIAAIVMGSIGLVIMLIVIIFYVVGIGVMAADSPSYYYDTYRYFQ